MSAPSIPDAEPTGLLLVQVGTPREPTTTAVRRYLRQFLGDPRVLDMPAWRRRLLLELVILPLRSRRSAAAYRKIWTAGGSPLLSFGQDLAIKVEARLGDARVELGMRYGEPSIASALERLGARGCRRIVVMPLYAQDTASATSSALAEVSLRAAASWDVPYLAVVPPFYDHPAYLDARAQLARPVLERVRPERVFFSFHGVPERHVRRTTPDGRCLTDADCCAALDGGNRHCYRAQCHATARLLGERLGVPAAQRVVCFQSRLGRTPWIRPYTDSELEAAAKSGIKNAVIWSSFATDCLETLEELGLRAVAQWREAGGDTLALAPSPNAEDLWADAVVAIARDATAWL